MGEARKIVAGLFISLDGVVESPEKWHFPYFDDEMGEVVGSAMAAADTMLLGRRTYEEFASFWPNADDEMAAYMNNTPKVVVSRTLEAATWQNSTLINDDVVRRITELKQQPGRNIGITGSPTLVRSLLSDRLLDELHLLVHPVVVGSGKRLFADGMGHVPLELVEVTTFKTGVVSLRYGPA
jgi:dihydrofolate reductase